MDSKREHITTGIARLLVALVFVINVSCALFFVFDPASYAPAYELAGVSGQVAVQGIGVAFLMWNATYPPVIVSPRKHRALFGVVLAQQIIGLIGETWILLSIPVGHELLCASILRFIVFDAAGLVALVIALLITRRKARSR